MENICMGCGMQLVAAAKFCPSCGARRERDKGTGKLEQAKITINQNAAFRKLQRMIDKESGKADGSNNTFKDATIEIKDNILSVGAHVLQISNISQMSIQRKKGLKALVLGFVMVFLSIVFYSLYMFFRILDNAFSYGKGAPEKGGWLFIMMAVVTLLIGVAMFVFVWYVRRGYYLRLEMDSGENFWLASSNKETLQEARKFLCDSANSRKSNKVTNVALNMADGKIYQGVSVAHVEGDANQSVIQSSETAYAAG